MSSLLNAFQQCWSNGTYIRRRYYYNTKMGGTLKEHKYVSDLLSCISLRWLENHPIESRERGWCQCGNPTERGGPDYMHTQNACGLLQDIM